MAMRRSTLLWLAVGLCALAPLTLPSLAMADDPVRAYVLIDTQPGKLEAAQRALSSLGNCLALEHHFMSDELIAHLHCTDAKYLTVAVTKDIAANPAVARVAVLAVLKGN